jgi:hypothetical protein
LDDLPGDNDPDGDNPGRVWVFDRSNGNVLLTLENPNADNQIPPHFISDRFGRSVATNGELIVIGSPQDSTTGVEQSGTAYVFDGDTGALRHTLVSPHLELGGDFGRSVAVTPEGHVFVGAWATTVNGLSRAGHAYLFDGETGNLLLTIPHPEPTNFDAFGWSVSAIDGRLIVGAPNANPLGPATGAVYVFEGIPEPGTVLLGVAGAVAGLIFYRAQARRVRSEKALGADTVASNLR